MTFSFLFGKHGVLRQVEGAAPKIGIITFLIVKPSLLIRIPPGQGFDHVTMRMD